ncbi:MAG TPA: hypothetical protein VKP30_18270 [Polyangiaceae bacterium]|nr:hypothetical protein [Polyangiaceae bacterium]
MKTSLTIFQCGSVVACTVAAALAGCSDDYKTPEPTGGAAGTTLSAAGATSAPGFGLGGTGARSAYPAGGSSFLQAGAAGLPLLVGVGGFSVAGAAGAPTAGTASAGEASLAGAAGAPPATFARVTLNLPSPNLRILSGKITPIPLTIKRDGSDYGVVNVVVEGVPGGIAATPVAVPDLATTSELQFVAQPSANSGGPYPITITASSATDPSIKSTASAKLYVADASGKLDVSFASSGKTTVKAIAPVPGWSVPSDFPYALAIDSQHRTLIGGNTFIGISRAWVLRLAANGMLDSTFDADGRMDSFGQQDSTLNQMAVNKDQLYVSVTQLEGTALAVHYLRKLAESGLSDKTFNGGLDVLLPTNSTAMVGYRSGALIASPAPIAYSGDGIVDSTFLAPTTLAGTKNLAADVANNVVYASALGELGQFEIGRLLGTGAVDNDHFGTQGVISVPCWDSKAQYANEVQSLLSGVNTVLIAVLNCAIRDSRYTNPHGSALVAVDSFGKIASGFGTRGTQIITETGYTLASLLQADGKVVVLTAETDASGNSSYTLKRYGTVSTSGSLDQSFATLGVFDLSSAYPGIQPRVMAYDAAAERLVLVATELSGSMSVYRFWL